MEQIQPVTADMPFYVILLISLVAFLLSVMLLWWAALIVHVRNASFVRSLLGSIGMSFAVLALSTVLGQLPEHAHRYYPLFLGGMVVLQLLILRIVFQTSTLKAVGMWVLNVVMILIVYSMFVMAMGGRGGAGAQGSRLLLWRPV